MTSDTLLRKCLHEKTKNQNESFNGMVWGRVLKTRYTTLEKLEFGVYDAIADFNCGPKATLNALCQLELNLGIYTGIQFSFRTYLFLLLLLQKQR